MKLTELIPSVLGEGGFDAANSTRAAGTIPRNHSNRRQTMSDLGSFDEIAADFIIAATGRQERTAPGGLIEYRSTRPRPFFEGLGVVYRVAVVPFDTERAAVTNIARMSSYLLVRKSGWTAVWTSKPLPIEVDDKIGKPDKRLARLFGIADAGRFFGPGKVRFRERKLGPATRLAVEGAEAVISTRFLQRVLAPEMALWKKQERSGNAQERVTARRRLRQLRRLLPHKGHIGHVYITILSKRGQLKGHAIVRDRKPGEEPFDILVPDDAWKGEIRMTDGRVFVAVTEAKSSRLRLDIQTLAMHGAGGFFEEFAKDAVTAFVQGAVDKIESGKYREVLQNLAENAGPDAFEAMRQWPLLEFVASGGDPNWFGWTVKAAARAVLSEVRAVADRLRVVVPGASRHYLYTSVNTGIPVERGAYKIVDGLGIIVNAVDYITADPSFENIHALNAWIEDGGDVKSLEPGIAERLGGMDQDDMVIVLGPFISRSPTMVGEWWWFPKMAAPEFGSLHKALLDREGPASLHAQLEAGGTGSRTKTNLVRAGRVLASNNSAIGTAALALRFARVAGMMPAEIPWSMEEITDAASKDLADCRPIVNWARSLISKVAKEGELPECMAQEIADVAQLDVESIHIAEGHWLDRLASHIDDTLEEAWKIVDEIAADAMPPLGMFDETHVRWDALAGEFRKNHREFWHHAFESFGLTADEGGEFDTSVLKDEDWDELRAQVAMDSMTWLQSTPDPVGVVGATAWRVYNQRLTSMDPGSVSDAIIFQEGVRDLLFEFLRRIGLLGEPAFDEEGDFWLTEAEGGEMEPLWTLKAYGIANFAAGPDAPKEEVKALKESGGYADFLLGLVVEIATESYRDRRGKTHDRAAILLDDVRIGCGGRDKFPPEEHPFWKVVDAMYDDGAVILTLRKFEVEAD